MPRRILVVDDAPPVRLLLKTYLQKLGVRDSDILVAEDGEQGVAVFREGAPDVVFVDIEMPKKGGEETATEMLGERPDLKVVVMTAVEPTDARVKQLRSFGAFAVLTKPVRMDKVKEVLDRVDEEQSNLQRIR